MFTVSKMAGVLLLAQLALAPAARCVEVGEPVHDFSARTLAGDPVSREALAGKPALIVFWNTWCPKCRDELPLVNRVAGNLSSRGITVLAINTALNDSEMKARAYWKKNGFVFPAAFDHSFEIGRAFRVAGVPTVLIIDGKGIVRYKDAVLPEKLEERLRQLTGR